MDGVNVKLDPDTSCSNHELYKSAFNKHSCNVCEKNFNQERNLKHHLKVHLSTGNDSDNAGRPHCSNQQNNQHACKICVKSFASQAALKTHIGKAHSNVSKDQTNGKKPFGCNLCGKYFSTRSLVKIHLRVHSKDKPFSCELCNAVFGYSSSLKFHLRTVHENEKPFQCGFCGKRFSSKTLVKVHMIVHTGVKAYDCDICGKSFGYLSSRNFHLKTVHGNEKPYDCSTCGKCFATHTLVKVHSRVHTKDKPYNCKYCNKSFGYTSSLSTHESHCNQAVDVDDPRILIPHPVKSDIYRMPAVNAFNNEQNQNPWPLAAASATQNPLQFALINFNAMRSKKETD